MIALKPLASSVVVSERFVKKRTCWPSGSKCCSKRVSAIAAAERAVVERHGEQQAALGLEHAPDLVERLADVRDVLEDLRAPDEVDGAVLERDRAVLHQAHVGVRDVLACALHRLLRDLHPDRVVEQREEAPGAAAEVEHAVARPDLGEQDPPARRERVWLRVLRGVRPERLVELAHQSMVNQTRSGQFAGRGCVTAARARARARFQPASDWAPGRKRMHGNCTSSGVASALSHIR